MKVKNNNIINWIIACLLFSFISCEYNVEEEVTSFICSPDLSFSVTIKPIIDNNCIQCHDGSYHPYDFRVFSVVENNASMIKQLTQNRVMPKEGSLTQEEIEQIACWVDNGAPNN